MKILVTGATGFIGRHLVPQLVQTGAAVSILVRENYALGDPLPPELATLRPQLSVVYADLRNYSLTRRAIQEAGPEAVLHLAAAGVTDPFLPVETALRHNLTGTLNLMRALYEGASEPWPRLVVGRTPGERSAMNVYAASKAAAWTFAQMYARTAGWPIYGAMIFQVYGPGQPAATLIPSALAAARSGADFPMTAGSQQRDWIHVDDVVQGVFAALAADLPPGTAFDLGTGQTASVAEVVKAIYRLVGRGGRPLVGALPNRPGEEPIQMAGADRTQRLIGWRAKIPLAEGLRKLIET
ncbi:MAG: NAD(P)-dependent oxidoreductase [Chloroflexota bacterium]